LSVRADGSHGTRRHAQLAFQAWVVRDRLIVCRRLGTNQDRTQQDEVAELWVDDVAVNAHVTEARSDGYRLMRDDPKLAAWKPIHLHRETHRRVQRTDSLLLQGRNNLSSDFIDVIAGVVKLQVGDRASRAADRLPIHPADEAQERLGCREHTQNVASLT